MLAAAVHAADGTPDPAVQFCQDYVTRATKGGGIPQAMVDKKVIARPARQKVKPKARVVPPYLRKK